MVSFRIPTFFVGKAVRGMALVAAFVLLPSIPPFRDMLSIPLTVSCKEATGDAVYVLAGGNAFRERIWTAVDLYQMGRVKKVVFLSDDGQTGSYNFKAGQNWSPTDWTLDYLRWRDVPREDVVVLENDRGRIVRYFDEARSLASVLPDSIRKLIIVTSPAHTRRSLLAFRRQRISV